MTKRYWALLAVAGLLIAGNAAWKHWLDAQLKAQEIAAERFANAEATKRMAIFAEAIRNH